MNSTNKKGVATLTPTTPPIKRKVSPLYRAKGKNSMNRAKFFEDLKKDRTTYRDMIDFCCDNMILNNEIIPALTSKGFYFEIENGCDYDEEDDCYYDIYQYFIIGSSDAERLEEYTNEIVYYCEELDMYILGVTHFGTPWNGVPASWKHSIEE